MTKAERDRGKFAAALAWASRQDEPFGVVEIGGRFGISRIASHTLIGRLMKEGAIVRVDGPASGRYVPAARAAA